eukprot:440645_1
MTDEKRDIDRWYWRSDTGYLALPDSASLLISNAPTNKAIEFAVNENNNKYKYQVVRTSKSCAWQRNKFTNKIRPVIKNVDDIKDETEILNRNDSRNPFAATKDDQSKLLRVEFQRFGEIFPGDSYVGGDYKWLHCQFMNDEFIEDILKKTAALIPNLDKLMDTQWRNPLKDAMKHVNPLSKTWFEKMIKLYTREGGQFYLVLNWNLRANEWSNIQTTLSPVVFALKCVCEGYCYKKFDDKKFVPYDGVLHRVMRYKAAIAKQIADFSVGDQIYFGGFTSTTKNEHMTKKIAKSRGFYYAPGKSGIYLNIIVHKEHKCAVDITEKSEFKYEEEVLISCFTRFEILKIDSNKGDKFIAVSLESLPPKYESWESWEFEKKQRDKLASYAFSYQFDKAIELVQKNRSTIPNLVNSTRPDSSKFWTIGHQIKHSKCKDADALLDKLRGLGYWDKARDYLGRPINDVNDKKDTEWKCSKCSQVNAIGHKFCQSCGNTKSEGYCVVM